VTLIHLFHNVYSCTCSGQHFSAVPFPSPITFLYPDSLPCLPSLSLPHIGPPFFPHLVAATRHVYGL
jgi:hypothetical protein